MIEFILGGIVGLLLAVIYLLFLVFTKIDGHETPVDKLVENVDKEIQMLKPRERGGIIEGNSTNDIIDLIHK